MDYDVLGLDWLDIERLIDAGLVDADDQVDLDALLDTSIPSLGRPMLNVADLVRLG